MYCLLYVRLHLNFTVRVVGTVIPILQMRKPGDIPLESDGVGVGTEDC